MQEEVLEVKRKKREKEREKEGKPPGLRIDEHTESQKGQWGKCKTKTKCFDNQKERVEE